MISSKLRELKDQNNMTNKEISTISGVPESTVPKMLSGDTQCPNFYAVADIVVAMGGSLDDMVGIRREESAQEDAVPTYVVGVYRDILSSKDKEIDRIERNCHIVEILAAILVALIFREI